jgi:hypothetical protein
MVDIFQPILQQQLVAISYKAQTNERMLMADREQQEPNQVIVERERKSHTGLIVTVVVVIVLVVLAIYGLPYLTGSGGGADVNVTPTPTTGQ